MRSMPKFNGASSRENLPRLKGGAYVINLDDKQSKGTYWVSSIIDRHAAVQFDSFEIEYIPQEMLNKIKNKSDSEYL